jgi:uncharacterized protein (UPF0332 family)
MTPEHQDLLVQARESLTAAKALHSQGFHGFAASRAYFTMFYVAEAFLLGKGLAFSKHSAVHAAFGEHFAKTGIVPPQFHRYLIRGMDVRHAGDYGKARSEPPEDAVEQIARAEKFLELAELHLGPIPPEGNHNVRVE